MGLLVNIYICEHTVDGCEILHQLIDAILMYIVYATIVPLFTRFHSYH